MESPNRKPSGNCFPAGVLSSLLLLLSCISFAVPALAFAADGPAADAENGVIAAVQSFLHEQSRDQAGQVQIRVFEGAASFPECPDPQPFLPRRGGQKLGGDVTVGVRCNGEAHDIRYLRARVSLFGDYLTIAENIARGTSLEASMLEEQQGDLSKLPPNAILDSGQAVGQLTRRRLSAGTVLQQQHLQRPALVERGQAVTIESRGSGFVVTREGEALEGGAQGETIRVRISRRESLRAVVVAGNRVRVGSR